MGLYIHPASKVTEEGIRLEGSMCWKSVQDQLRQGEHLAAFVHCQHSPVALLIENKVEFDNQGCAGNDIYIIDADLAAQAS